MSRLLLASIHDVSPRFESGIDRLLSVLRPYVGERIAMLVVPNHWRGAAIVPGSPFATRLRAWSDAGIEMFLHGYYHRDETRHRRASAVLRGRFMTAGEGEFLGLSRSEARKRIEEGRKLVEDVTGSPVAGFVAPAWLYGAGSLGALTDCRIPMAENHWRIWSPATGTELARGPVITWASRTRARLGSSLVAAAALRYSPQRVLRIGVHPPDSDHAAIVRSIGKTFEVATHGRVIGRYSNLW